MQLETKNEFDFDEAEMYANTRCPNCCGRGYIIAETGLYHPTIRRGEPTQKYIYHCSCTQKNMKRYKV